MTTGAFGEAERGDFRSDGEILLDIVKTSMDAIVERSLRDPSYPWIDTKLNVVHGRDFDPEDPLRGKGTVYSWIQGRGLEALAEHLRFFETRGLLEKEASGKYRIVLRRAADALDAARENGSGHLFFSLNRGGLPKEWSETEGWKPKILTPASPCNLSDIFGSRGLYAASMGLNPGEEASAAYCEAVYEAVLRGDYESDQQQFDPKNPVRAVPGRISHAPFMLQIPTLTLFLRAGRAEAAFGGVLDAGLKLIEGILLRHVNEGGRFPGLAPFDFVEFIDKDGRPFEGRALSDPGHALEFAGLAGSFCASALAPAASSRKRIAEIRRSLLGIFRRSFALGFDESLGGIVKLVDLGAERRVNSDMPWWSLPETMRAALECAAVAEKKDESFYLTAYVKCRTALVDNYVSERAHRLCLQTRDGEGRPVDVIPAVPDADPGYHTGLSLLRCLELLPLLK